MKKVIKENVKLVLVSIITAIICISGTVLAESVINANQIGYNNTTVKDALDGMYRINSFQTDYSTEEKVVGRWIDGKPLYQITITTTLSTSQTLGNNLYSGELALSNVSSDIDMAFFINDKSFYTLSNTSRGFVSGWYQSESKSLFIITLFERSNISSTITIQYTKTTDTAQ